MIRFSEIAPPVEVPAAEYHRLLGYPRDHELTDRAAELAAGARAWYARHGRPWIHAREAGKLEVDGANIRLGDEAFTSARFGKSLREAEAHAAVLVAVSAGPELEAESQKLWREEKPDEYFFLEMYGAAVVEQLTTVAGARLCGWAEQHGMAVLPHYSPGYPEWDVAEQPRLLKLIHRADLPGALEALDSGALRPRKSLLAVFGITSLTGRVKPLNEVVACANCTFAPCAYRRVPYGGEPAKELPYRVNVRALKRWAQERLALEWRDDGSVEAKFRYDGTTCTNMGRALTFEYRVRLGPPETGYCIREQQCAPAPGDTGHTFMCRYIDSRDRLMSAIETEKPLLGRPLHEVLSWNRPACAAGCFCDADARGHKWGLVLETIQYALANREGRL